MGHDKLRKFAENETFACLVQPDTRSLLSDGYFALKNHPMKGHWADFFASLAGREAAADRPLVVELGCGKGEYTVDLALRRPESDCIGVDIKGARLWKGAGYATAHKMPNVAFLRTRIEFIEAFFAPGEVSEIWLTFSDPQIRKENARLSSPLFLERYRKFLRKGGVVHLKTDSRFLYEYTLAVCSVNSFEVLACTTDLYAEQGRHSAGLLSRPELYEVQTFYEKMFLEQGYKINYLAFRIDAPQAASAGTPAGDSDGDGAVAAIMSPEGAGRSQEGAVKSPEGAGRTLEGAIKSPEAAGTFDAAYWRSVEGPRQLFGRDTAETRRQKLHESEG